MVKIRSITAEKRTKMNVSSSIREGLVVGLGGVCTVKIMSNRTLSYVGFELFGAELRLGFD